VRSNFVVIEHTSKMVNVHCYSTDRDMVPGNPIVTAGTVWVDPRTKHLFLLVLNECLYFGDRLNNSLICPNQLRANGVIVHDVPSQFDIKSTNSIKVDDITIPLQLRGAVSYFETQLPRTEELGYLPRILLTSTTDWFEIPSKLSSLDPTRNRWIAHLS
jgi:hypothetical protein